MPNLCFPYLCQSLQAAFEKVKQEPPTEPGEGAGLYSCEHHQLSAIQVGLLLKRLRFVALSFLLCLCPPPLASPATVKPLLALLLRPPPCHFWTCTSHFEVVPKTGPGCTAKFWIHESDHCLPTAGSLLTALPYPTNFLDVPAVALILHDQM